MKRVPVDGCRGCPFSYDPNFSCGCQPWTCTAKDGPLGYVEIPRRNVFGKPPRWCPLRENDRLVTLRAK